MLVKLSDFLFFFFYNYFYYLFLVGVGLEASVADSADSISVKNAEIAVESQDSDKIQVSSSL